MWDLKFSWQLKMIKSSQAISQVNLTPPATLSRVRVCPWRRGLRGSLLYINQPTVFTHHIIPWCCKQRRPPKCWTFVQDLHDWSPERILSYNVYHKPKETGAKDDITDMTVFNETRLWPTEGCSIAWTF
jgi:hypothetical protein